jgi:Ca-activated chloride channel homolog
MRKIFIVLLSVFMVQAYAQRIISGTVRDNANNPLVGVAIVIKGTKDGTVTDYDGKYALKIENTAKTLVFSAVGYQTQEIPIEKSNTIDVILAEGQLLECIVVTGYAVQRRKEVTGAVSKVTEQALQGRVAGVTVRGRKKLFGKKNNVQSTPSISNNSNENYDKIKENGFFTVKDHALSTFSTDVDRAAYANVRRFINNNEMPPQDAVRIEEMINYFDYKYPQPQGSDPLSISTELTDCPWNKDLKLLHVGLQAKNY